MASSSSPQTGTYTLDCEEPVLKPFGLIFECLMNY